MLRWTHAIELHRRNEDHAEIGNYMTTVKRILEAEEEGFFQALSPRMIGMPFLNPGLVTFGLEDKVLLTVIRNSGPQGPGSYRKDYRGIRRHSGYVSAGPSRP